MVLREKEEIRCGWSRGMEREHTDIEGRRRKLGSLKYLAKKPGLYKPGISESLKMFEESNYNYIKHSKLGGKIKGFIGSQNTNIWVLVQPFTRCKP